MPKSYKGYNFILYIIDEVMNYLITVLISPSRSEEIGDALIDNVISKYCIPDYIIMNEDSVFLSSLMNYLFQKFGIKIETVAPCNHLSLQAEHGIKSLYITETIDRFMSNVDKYLPLAMFAYNTSVVQM